MSLTSALRTRWRERSRGQITLPHGSQIGQFILHEGEALRYSAEDLANFSCALQLPHEKIKRNAVGPPFRAWELEAAGLELPEWATAQDWLYPAFSTLAMGDI